MTLANVETGEVVVLMDRAEAEQRRRDRNRAFGEHLVGMWALLGATPEVIDTLVCEWDPAECPQWRVEPHRRLFSAAGFRAIADRMHDLADRWDDR